MRLQREQTELIPRQNPLTILITCWAEELLFLSTLIPKPSSGSPLSVRFFFFFSEVPISTGVGTFKDTELAKVSFSAQLSVVWLTV